MLEIGSLKLNSPLILSPMAGISDLPYRLINRGLGCELAFIEMTSVQGLVYKNHKTLRMIETGEEERPVGIQLLGKEPEHILITLDMLSEKKLDIIDFNAACPVRKVTSNGEGASLLREPLKLKRLLKVIVERAGVPVTVKIRSGWDEHSVNAKDVALHAEDAGISGLFLHGRTKAQQYSGSVDYHIISEVKKALKIPVIASGDILSPALAKKMFDETGCDGLAVARGALGNPWIFREINEYLKSGMLLDRPGVSEVVRVMKEHFALCAGHYGPSHGVKVFRKFFIWYTKGLPGIKALREQAMHEAMPDGINDIIEEIARYEDFHAQGQENVRV